MTPEDAEEKAMSDEDLDAVETAIGLSGPTEPPAEAWETRAVGDHDWDSWWDDTQGWLARCRRCRLPGNDWPCPSVQERRLVGPWEPVRREVEA